MAPKKEDAVVIKESGALAVVGTAEEMLAQLASNAETGVEVFDTITAGGYLPRIQLESDSCKPVKLGLFPRNHYALVKGSELIDLGEKTKILPLAFRPMALDTSDDEVSAAYDEKSDEFKRIQAESELKDSGCQFGIQFLVYLPDRNTLATLFMGSKSARKEAHTIYSRIGKMCTMTSRSAEKGKNVWTVPYGTQCSEAPERLPDPAILAEELAKFKNPQPDAEVVTPAQQTGRVR